MHRYTFLLSVLLLIAPTISAEEPKQPQVTVYAAASLREALTAIASQYKKNTKETVRLEFDASSTLARRIQAGAAADVFISADIEWMDALTPKERFNWLGNRLVCITLASSTRDCKNAQTLILGGEQVPVGKYAKVALDNIEANEPQRVIYGANVRDVLTKVVEGAGEAGVVYRTDALVEPKVKVAFEFPVASYPAIIYPVGILSEKGQAFAKALRETWAKEIAKQRGFLAP